MASVSVADRHTLSARAHPHSTRHTAHGTRVQRVRRLAQPSVSPCQRFRQELSGCLNACCSRVCRLPGAYAASASSGPAWSTFTASSWAVSPWDRPQPCLSAAPPPTKTMGCTSSESLHLNLCQQLQQQRRLWHVAHCHRYRAVTAAERRVTTEKAVTVLAQQRRTWVW
jgi:hypothetical protein